MYLLPAARIDKEEHAKAAKMKNARACCGEFQWSSSSPFGIILDPTKQRDSVGNEKQETPAVDWQNYAIFKLF